MKLYGNKLKELRLQHGLSLQMLADKIGGTKSNLSRWERNISTPRAHFVKKLSEVLGVSISVFTDLDDPDTLDDMINKLPEDLKVLCKVFLRMDSEQRSKLKNIFMELLTGLDNEIE